MFTIKPGVKLKTKYKQTLLRNWTIHNMISHPLSEIAYWVLGERVGNWIHDITIPEHIKGTGRG